MVSRLPPAEGRVSSCVWPSRRGALRNQPLLRRRRCDLAYIVGIEHTTASVRGAPAVPYSLRVTTIFRREGGEWKVVHRHGDPVPDSDSAGGLLDRLKAERDASTP